jgi:acetylornithine deacetylase
MSGQATPGDCRQAARDARRLLRPLRDAMAELLTKLVQADTTAVVPHGKELAGQRVLQQFCKAHKLPAELYDTAPLLAGHPGARPRNYEGRPNLVARLGGRGTGPSLLLSGHVDVVPAQPTGWRHGPFDATMRGGRLYGRGAFDMKGGLAAQFAAAAALRRSGAKLGGDLLVESVVDEEWAGGGGTLAARLRGDTADACLIGEGTGLAVVRATRGAWFIEITARAGDPSAYFSTDEVVSPAMPMGRLLAWVEGWKKRRARVRRGNTYAAFSDPAPVQVLALEANRFDPTTPWSVPLEAKLRIYFQFLPHEDQPAVCDSIRRSFRQFVEADPFFRVSPPSWHEVVDPPLLGHELPAEHPWTRCLGDCTAAVLRKPAEVTAAPYPCDAFICQRQFDIPTLLLGPTGAGAHNVNEYVELASVHRAAEAMLAAALVWCA